MPRYPLTQVLASNAAVKDPSNQSFGPGLVGVFAGGTSGIGETTLKAFAQHTISPRIYVIGRNQSAFDRIASEVQTINSEAKLKFLPADCSELKEVDRGKAQVNFLVLTIGFLSLAGRNESSDGLDRKMACNYYSRLRFVDRLQPLLNTAAAAQRPSRVLSVLNADKDGLLDLKDLDLKNSYGLGKSLTHCAGMMNFAFEELAKENLGTAYVHTSPGIVKSQFMRPFEVGVMKVVWGVLWTLFKPWETDFKESGERHLHMGFSGTGLWVPRSEKGEGAAVGSDGTKGSGFYTLGSEGQSVGNGSAMRKQREEGVGKTVVEHLRSVFAKAEKLPSEA